MKLAKAESSALKKTIPDLIASAKNALKLVSKLKVTDDESIARAGDMLQKIAAHAKLVDARRKAEKEPHLAACNAVDAKYKPVKQLLAQCEVYLREKIREPLRLQREAQERALAKVERKGGIVGKETLAIAHGVEHIAAPATIQETSKLTWTVVDISLVPRKFLCVDEERVNTALEAGYREIPGLEIKREYDIRRKGIVRG
jgi:hypothetical protein